MITLTQHQQQAFAEYVPEMAIAPDSVAVKLGSEDAMTFPSALYPLGNPETIRLFHGITNVAPLADAEAMALYDSLAFETGRCYTNTERILTAFNQAGLGNAITSMTGWLFIGATPIHHCWAVYKGVHVLDPGMDITPFLLQERLAQEPAQPTGDALRALYLEQKERAARLPNHEAQTFGQIFPGTVYIGSETTPQEGRAIYNALIQAFPNHPSYAGDGMNARGASRMQEMEASRKKKAKRLPKRKKKR